MGAEDVMDKNTHPNVFADSIFSHINPPVYC